MLLFAAIFLLYLSKPTVLAPLFFVMGTDDPGRSIQRKKALRRAQQAPDPEAAVARTMAQIGPAPTLGDTAREVQQYMMHHERRRGSGPYDYDGTADGEGHEGTHRGRRTVVRSVTADSELPTYRESRSTSSVSRSGGSMPVH